MRYENILSKIHLHKIFYTTDFLQQSRHSGSSLFPLLSSLCLLSTRRRGRNHMKKSSLLPGSMDSAPPGNEEISPGLSASSYIVRDNRKTSQAKRQNWEFRLESWELRSRGSAAIGTLMTLHKQREIDSAEGPFLGKGLPNGAMLFS